MCFRTFKTIQEKWGNLVNEAVKGALFIIEQSTIMIWLLFKKKATKSTHTHTLAVESCSNFTRKPNFLKAAIL